MKKFTVIFLSVLLTCTYGEELESLLATRIVGGTNATDGEFPFIVSLRNRYRQHFCGGSIINNYNILTAAHCLAGASASAITVVVGTNTLNYGGSSYSVERIIVHKEYSEANSWKNDIAILKLSSPITFNSKQQPVNLPDPDDFANDGVSVVASGWGYTRYPPTGAPNNLQKINLSVISNESCQDQHSGYTIFETSVCASAGTGKGVCNGDSGGPLTRNGTQVGIVSWGVPCAKGYPDIYTRVSKYISWIEENAI